MAEKERTSVTSAQDSETLKALINIVNATDSSPVMPGKVGYEVDFRSLCRTVHEMAQIAALPADMREDYAKAVIGTDEEWEKFCRRLPAPLWRGWTDIDPPPALWTGPRFLQSLKIGDDGRWTRGEFYVLQNLENIEARRLRECRVCQRIFWATRIEKSGGPYGCSPECNNRLRQRTYKEKKKLAEKDRKRRKKP